MSKLRNSKVKNYILSLLAVFIVIMGLLFYQEKAEDRRQYELFLNHFYSELTWTISSIDGVLSLEPELMERDENILIEILYKIEKCLERTGLMLASGSYLVDNHIRTENIYFHNRGIPSFGEDDELDEVEIKYLMKLKEELEYIYNGMYSEETGQENPNLSIEQFNELIYEATK